jgi:hypothetical protein
MKTSILLLAASLALFCAALRWQPPRAEPVQPLLVDFPWPPDDGPLPIWPPYPYPWPPLPHPIPWG